MNFAATDLTPAEQKAVDKLIEHLSAKMLRENPPPQTIHRDAHPKQIGLVRALFTIENSLPSDLKVGIFATPKTYPAWIRFSNQSAPPAADKVKDIRGMAIKLVGVEGRKILEGAENEITQDFILISTDVFVTRNIEQFAGLISALGAGQLWLAIFFILHPKNLWNFIQSNKAFGSILEARFWSVSPYAFGRSVVKYSARPQSAPETLVPATPAPAYLTTVMEKQLDERDYSFDFLVQFQVDPVRMPVEDLSVRWRESDSPFRKVATITIPRQTFKSREQDAYGEQLSFNPWHSLPEHTPQGGINKGRRIIYQALSKFRHAENNARRAEPTNMDLAPISPEE